MIRLSHILNRIALVRAEYLSDGSYQTSVCVVCGDVITPSEWKQIKGLLTAVVVCGCGVVTKSCDSDVAARVKADAETFLWSSADTRLSFMRQERLLALKAELDDRKIVPVQICCADVAEDFATTTKEHVAQIYANLHWKKLFRPCNESSAAAQALVRRLALPVLGVFLTLLIGNMLLSSKVNTRHQLLQSQLSAQEHTESEFKSVNARHQELLSEFATRPAVGRAVVCDRIARAVPEQVKLTALEIEPPAKRFEAKKPFLRREGVVLIGGTAPTAADISRFTGRLSELTCCHDVRLTSVEKERDGNRLNFRIELGL